MTAIRAFGTRPPRVLLTKIGLDGHDRGIRIVASYLRDAGMEVVYTGPWQEVPAVVKVALEEDVDAIGVSSLATDHLLIPKLMRSLHESGLGHIPVMVGGIVPTQEEGSLMQSGVIAVVHPGARREEIVSVISDAIEKARTREMGQ